MHFSGGALGPNLRREWPNLRREWPASDMWRLRYPAAPRGPSASSKNRNGARYELGYSPSPIRGRATQMSPQCRADGRQRLGMTLDQ